MRQQAAADRVCFVDTAVISVANLVPPVQLALLATRSIPAIPQQPDYSSPAPLYVGAADDEIRIVSIWGLSSFLAAGDFPRCIV